MKQNEIINMLKSKVNIENESAFNGIDKLKKIKLYILANDIGNNDGLNKILGSDNNNPIFTMMDNIGRFFDEKVFPFKSWFNNERTQSISDDDFNNLQNDKKGRKNKIKKFFVIYCMSILFVKSFVNNENEFTADLTEENFIKILGLRCRQSNMARSQPALHNFYLNLKDIYNAIFKHDTERINRNTDIAKLKEKIANLNDLKNLYEEYITDFKKIVYLTVEKNKDIHNFLEDKDDLLQHKFGLKEFFNA